MLFPPARGLTFGCGGNVMVAIAPISATIPQGPSVNLLYAKSLWMETAGQSGQGLGVPGFGRLVVAAGELRLYNVGRCRGRAAVKVDLEFHAIIGEQSAVAERKWCRAGLTGPPWYGVTTEPR